MTDEELHNEREGHKHFGATINGEVWELLGKPERTTEENGRMVHAAHASHYHWLKAGTAVHHQRGEWLISHVYAELGLAEAALRHAQRCLALTEAHQAEMEDYDRAYAYEAMARANALAGNTDEAAKFIELAETAGETIADQENRVIYCGDLAGGNWAGVR